MSDFDELSRRNWEHRRTRKQHREPLDPDEPSPTGRLSAEDDDVEQAERRSTLNPDWRRGRTTRSRGRRTTGAIYASPQEFQLWLQQGGWMWGAVGALLVIGVLVVVLMQGRDAQSDTTTAAPPASNNTAVEADEEGAGTNVNTSAADDADGAAGVPALPEQPTLTPAPPAQSQPGRDTFVVVNTGTQGLFLRAEPSTNGTILETLRDGTEVEQIGEDDIGANYVWRHVRAPGGQEGWVAVDWLQPAP